MTERKRLGLIVNPIAGMGGAVGLKGTDRPETLNCARELGAVPHSGERAAATLAVVREWFGDGVTIVAAGGAMGEEAARAAGFDPEVIGPVAGETTAADTRTAAARMAAYGVDLLLFADSDGTARDIYAAIGSGLPALGIPSGVKMHSAVYATTPRAAGETVVRFLTSGAARCREAEVMDIDEDAFRDGRVSARLFGMLLTPDVPHLIQRLKAGSGGGGTGALVGIADEVIERMRDGALYIIGPGTTTRAIVERMGGEKTLLGLDLYCR